MRERNRPAGARQRGIEDLCPRQSVSRRAGCCGGDACQCGGVTKRATLTEDRERPRQRGRWLLMVGSPTRRKLPNTNKMVRCLLVPAVMVRMGQHNWYMPRWLDNVTPRVSIEGAEFFAERDRPTPVEPEPVVAVAAGSES